MNSFSEYLCIKTDDTLRETQPHGDSRYPFAYYLEDIWQFDFHLMNWHWHHELEFLSVSKGVVHCLVGEDKIELPRGFGLFVNSGILHRYEATGSTLVPNILFSPTLLAAEKSLVYEKYVQPVLQASTSYQILDPGIKWQSDILQALNEIYRLQKTDENELQTTCSALNMWDILYRHLDLSPAGNAARHFNHKQAKLQTMMQYIHDHYHNPITLDEIAASALISKSSALHIFQSGIHIPPVTYLIQYRLTRAAELLGTTEKPVSSIAEETGFTSAGYFCRKFKEQYQISPGAYRNKKNQPD